MQGIQTGIIYKVETVEVIRVELLRGCGGSELDPERRVIQWWVGGQMIGEHDPHSRRTRLEEAARFDELYPESQQ